MDIWGVNGGLEVWKENLWFKRKICNEALKMPMLAANGSIYSQGWQDTLFRREMCLRI